MNDCLIKFFNQNKKIVITSTKKIMMYLLKNKKTIHLVFLIYESYF